jgi:ABC-type lipoprotein release transport system permease subunit
MTRGLHGTIQSSPEPFLLVTGFLAAVALLASYIPARRTLRHDPTRALRHE